MKPAAVVVAVATIIDTITPSSHPRSLLSASPTAIAQMRPRTSSINAFPNANICPDIHDIVLKWVNQNGVVRQIYWRADIRPSRRPGQCVKSLEDVSRLVGRALIEPG